MEKNKTPKLKGVRQIKWLSFVGVLILLIIIPFVWNYMSTNFINTLSRQDEFRRLEIMEEPQKEINLMEQSQNEEGAGEIKNTVTIGKADISGLGPVESYLIIRSELAKVRNISDLSIFTEAYGSNDNIYRVRQLSALIDIVGEETIMSIIISAAVDKIQSAEIITSSTNDAVIKITSEKGEEGRAIMIYEREEWRLSREEW